MVGAPEWVCARDSICVTVTLSADSRRKRLADARQRRGLLLLHRSGLSPLTPCQSPGALTDVTARRIAQPPKAVFVARLRPGPARPLASYQIQTTTIWVEPSSTGDTRRQDALRDPGYALRLSP